MKISIQKPFLPFSHEMPTWTILPYSFIGLEIYPAFIAIYDLSSGYFRKLLKEIELTNFGPMEEFLVTLNLEEGCVEVSGFLKTGVLRYRIEAHETKGCLLTMINIPDKSGGTIFGERLLKGEELTLYPTIKTPSLIHKERLLHERERLSLGSHKAQDVHEIFKRKDLTEILPLWFLLSQSVPYSDAPIEEGLTTLYSEAWDAIHNKEKEKIEKALLSLFQVGFKSLFWPRLIDDSYQGYRAMAVKYEDTTSPLTLLQKSYPLLGGMFFHLEKNTYHFLPALPPQLHCGKLTNLRTPLGHTLSFEWSKKMMSQVIIESQEESIATLSFDPEIKRFRVYDLTLNKPLGFQDNNLNLFFKKDQRYLLDNFQK